VKAALILSNVTCIRRAYAAYSISLQTITKSGQEPELCDKAQPILDIPQVAITLGYRHHAPARAPIDAGELVADNGKVGDYRY
jgi:hypothetical protein